MEDSIVIAVLIALVLGMVILLVGLRRRPQPATFPLRRIFSIFIAPDSALLREEGLDDRLEPWLDGAVAEIAGHVALREGCRILFVCHPGLDSSTWLGDTLREGLVALVAERAGASIHEVDMHIQTTLIKVRDLGELALEYEEAVRDERATPRAFSPRNAEGEYLFN